jgi:hypothetical protein
VTDAYQLVVATLPKRDRPKWGSSQNLPQNLR